MAVGAQASLAADATNSEQEEPSRRPDIVYQELDGQLIIGAEIGVKGRAMLSRDHCEALAAVIHPRIIQLVRCRLSNEGLREFCGNQKLETITIQQSNLTNEGLRYLMAAPI